MIKRIWDITLTVSDLKRAVDFYQKVLGLTKKYEFKDYAGFDCGGIELGIKTWGERENPRKGEPSFSFLVDDIDKAYEELKAKGVEFVEPPRDTLWGARAAIFLDPDGHQIQLLQIKWKKYFETAQKGGEN
jgi:catechol 2,3-dioxygenase-like lactoylglutathione lyase family enzyme